MSSTSTQQSASSGGGLSLKSLTGGLSTWVIVLIAIPAILLIYGAFTTENFLTAQNIKTILRSTAFVGIFAIGLTFVTISGNFFLLSLEETAGLASLMFAFTLASGLDEGTGWLTRMFGFSDGLGLIPALVVTVGVAVLIGAVQGAIVGSGGNPIVVTLGAAGIIFGIASWTSNNAVIFIERPHPAEWLGTGLTATVPNVTWAFVVLAILGEIVLRYTSFGRSCYLVGASKDTAHSTGYNSFWKAVQVFALASVAAALVGILFAAQISQGQVSLFRAAMGSSGSLAISAIASVMVGGTSVFGGRGSIWQTVLGALFISVVDNMMVLRGFESGPRILFVGLTVVASISLYALIRRNRTR
ncbi:MAG: ABC transporter permease [Chloroflexota bacterium]